MQTKAGIITKSIFMALLLFCANTAIAQRFFNLTADEVKIDSVLPVVRYVMPLDGDSADSVYTAEVKYAEFIDMTQSDIDLYNKVSGEPLPELPVVEQYTITSDKKQSLMFTLTPLVYRDGKYQMLVSYMLDVKARPVAMAKGMKASAASRYADHSVLASGRWAKIRVPETGYYRLTEDVIRRAGFKDINKVKIYGYGGNMVPEILTDSYLRDNDDLRQVPSAMVDGRRIFFGKGPVTWNSATTEVRTRNPYSTHGYYFITENDEETVFVSAEELLGSTYPATNDYHSLREVDNYAWFEGGRNLVEGTYIKDSKTYTLKNPSADTSGTLTVSMSASTNSKYSVNVNGNDVANSNITMASYDKASFTTQTYSIKNLQENNEITINVKEGGPLRLDYLSIRTLSPSPAPDLSSADIPAAEYVYNITNQDHHADSNVDLTIIIPTSQLFLDQAQRLKEHHEKHDGMTVRIVPADEIYNEFSSGTPDVSAYRRYMKMMYDRATTKAEQPKYLLLFGDCVWDNRLLTSNCSSLKADNLLLCFESENSYNEVSCFVSDDFIGMLDDKEAISTGSLYLGTPDIGVGRFPAISEELARIMVDKTINYATNANAGPWQNIIMFMGDDGNNNLHMKDVDYVADKIARTCPGFNIRKIMWDAYNRTSSSTGARYPDVEDAIRNQQQNGALIMDYAGHGAANSISHEYVLRLGDFVGFTNTNLPLWVTASCDIGPFDGTSSTIGETVLTNPNGGGIGFFGTTRTVYANYNRIINEAFMDAVLDAPNGKQNTLGDAVRVAKTYITTSDPTNPQKALDQGVNKLQYSLLGDPAVTLNIARNKCVIDEINGVKIDGTNKPTISANSKVTLTGHIERNGKIIEDMNGSVFVLVRDSRELVTCLNNAKDADEPFTFYDRKKTLFTGNDNVRDGKFSITFTVPRDINYSNATGLITLFANNDDATITAHGECEDFLVGGSEELPNDFIGPSIYCYLNSPSFMNGDEVNATPYFVAEVKDKDGINASGAGIGHDLQLSIDNQLSMTYNLNDNFKFDFGTYTSGSTFFSIPTLSEGPHTLKFRAWDILNNASTTTLSFTVAASQKPTLVDVNVTKNPAKDATTFIATHDRPGSQVIMKVEIFDMSGRLLHTISQATISGSATTTMNWDLTTSSGNRLQTGVYLYRVNISGSDTAVSSKAKKLVII